MNYTFNQLEIFLKVIETQSVTKAAEALHLSQPAVSIQLKNFQEQFDVPLTEVVGRKIHITDFGREIGLAAQKILQEANTIQHLAQAYKGLLSGKLKLAVVSTGKYVMPRFLAGFMQMHPDLALEMTVTNKQKVLESLEQNLVDFALVSVLPSQMQVEKIDLLKNKLYLVGSHQLPVKNPEKVLDKLQELPLIFREEGSGTRYVMEKFIARHKIRVQKKLELTSNEAVKQAVIAGLGYSIMPLIGIRNELLNGEIQIIPVKGLPIKTTWSMLWLKGKRHSPVAAAFLQYIKSKKAAIISQHFDWYEDY